MRLVLDTDVMVAAIRSDAGASRRLLMGCLDGRLRPLASVPLFVEYEATMTRRDHLAAAGLSARDVGTLLDALATVVEPVALQFLWRPLLNDPGDDMVLETAVNGQADAIVTFNRRDFAATAPRFGLEILSPAASLRRLESKA